MVRQKNRWAVVVVHSALPSMESVAAPDTVEDHLPCGPYPIAQLTSANVLQLLKQSLKENFGDLGCAPLPRLSVIYANPKTSTFILRFPAKHEELIVPCMLLLDSAFDMRVAMRIVHIGGTLRKCEQWIVRDLQSELAASAAL
eukprot:Lankesteria_metandrocarpae@DN3428_c0_g1_i1.p1